MFDRKKFDAHLEVACVRKHHLWAARIESAITPSVRSAARAFHLTGHQTSRDMLLATGIVSSLVTAIPRRRYEDLVKNAQHAGAEKPRLLLRADAGFIAALRDDDESRSLTLNRMLRKHLRERLLEPYDVTFESVPNVYEDGSQKALTFFAFRTIQQPELEGLPRLYQPHAISTIDPPPSRTLEPLTPTYFTS